MSSRRKRDAALARIYARIPEVPCKGLCHEACGPIGMSFAEARVIEDTTGAPLPAYDEARSCCPFLNEENRCGIYDQRPVLCRLYGAIPNLPCPHGCLPEWSLSDYDGGMLLLAADAITGAPEVLLYPRGWDRVLARRRAAEAFVDQFVDPKAPSARPELRAPSSELGGREVSPLSPLGARSSELGAGAKRP